MKAGMESYVETRRLLLNEADRRARVEKLRVKKEWTAYWEGMEIDPKEQVKTTVHYSLTLVNRYDLIGRGKSVIGNGVEILEELTLRKGFEWSDFQFMMGVRLKDKKLEATMHGKPWDCQGELVMNGGNITASPLDAAFFGKLEKRDRREEEAWQLIAERTR
jgi:hypothetical protein